MVRGRVKENTVESNDVKDEISDVKMNNLLTDAKPDIVEFCKTMSKSELEFLIDHGTKLDLEIKVRKKVLDGIKDILKAKSIANNQSKFVSSSGCSAFLSDKNVRSINPTDFVKLLKKLGKQKNFNDFVSVKLTEAIKFLGEASLNDIITIDPIPAYTCKFKR